MAFTHAVSSLSDMFGIKTRVRTAERINREMKQFVSDYRESQQRPDQETEGEMLVVTADGKGVSMRRTTESDDGN